MGKVYVVGIGPGNREGMTLQAVSAIRESTVIAGYTRYLELIPDLCQGKRIISTPMTRETRRCRMALQAAQEGAVVAMVCSGDAGVYGMAGLLYELSGEFAPVEIEPVPGVTAACSGAALLGAPLGHDFAVISLSDLLTPWELIEKRLDAAAKADFCICLYNPASKSRPDHLKRACEVLLRSRRPENAAGVVRNIGREGQSAQTMTLGELSSYPADMFTTVFVGNTQTKIVDGKLVTPRGYGNG